MIFLLRRVLAKARTVRAYVRARTKGHPGPPIAVARHSDRRAPARVKPWVMPAPDVPAEQQIAAPMVYTGDRPGPALAEELRRRGWGIMSITGRPPEGLRWAFDNGAFGAARKGEAWSGRDYLDRLRTALSQPVPPDFLVVPDFPILGEPGTDVWSKPGVSLHNSLAWINSGALPYRIPWYLAVQNGDSPAEVGRLMDEGDLPIQGIFLGGNDAFKEATAQKWADLAREHGIGFHYARTSTQRKIRHAFAVGADSMDSAQMLRSKGEWRKTTQAFYAGIAQEPLPLGKARRVRAYVRARAKGQMGLPIIVPEHADVRPAARLRMVVVRVKRPPAAEQLEIKVHPPQRYGSGSDESNHWLMAVPCPTCGAKIGHGCDIPWDAKTHGWHKERRKAARQAKAIHNATEVLAPQLPPKPAGGGINWIKDEEIRAAGFVLGQGYTGIGAHGRYSVEGTERRGFSLYYQPDAGGKGERIGDHIGSVRQARQLAEQHARRALDALARLAGQIPEPPERINRQGGLFDEPGEAPAPAPKAAPAPAPPPRPVLTGPVDYQAVPCRCCKAPAGEACRNARRDMAHGVHAVRRQDAEADAIFSRHAPEINTEPDEPAPLKKAWWPLLWKCLRLLRKELSPEELAAHRKSVARTARTGKFGETSRVRRHIENTIPPDRRHESVLDFGAGPGIHTRKLRDADPPFTNVTAHDLPESEKRFPGVRDPQALSRRYQHVMASKVVNVQEHPAELHSVLRDIAGATHPTEGRAVFDFPEPHKGIARGLDTPTVENAVRQHFGDVKQVGGSKHEPIWEARHPIRK